MLVFSYQLEFLEQIAFTPSHKNVKKEKNIIFKTFIILNTCLLDMGAHCYKINKNANEKEANCENKEKKRIKRK